MSNFVVLQRAETSALGSMTVDIERSLVTGGSAGTAFDNDAGLLRISGLQVRELMAMALVATANNGASFLEDSDVSRK